MKKKNIFKIQGLLTVFFLSLSLLVNTAYATTSWGFKDSKTGTGFSGYAQQSDCQTALANAKQTFPTSTFTDCSQATDATLNYTPAATPAPVLIIPNTNPQAPASSVTGVYNLLAPIGNISQVKTNDIGTYLNWIFKLGIGLCAALAVIMIIIAAIQYMGTESVFGKTEARSKILQSILGLVLAMGSYAILNTISPDLLGANGVNVTQVTAQIDPDTETAPPASTSYTGSGSSALCTAGYVNVATYGSPSNINVCSSLNNIPIATNLKNMLAAAKTSNIILSGYGSRSAATQVQLRIAHGCPDPNTPASSCTPPTARPGHSNHEVGGAVDFTCSGASIQSQSSPCFIWMSRNAATFGFYNLPSEPWHWSFNAK